MIVNLKNFKWTQPLLICFLIASPCFSAENKHPLLVQTTTEYWLEKIERCEKERKTFTVEIEQGKDYSNNKMTEKQLQESVLALAKAIKSNPSSLTAIKISTAVPKLEEETDGNIPYKEREARNISKQKEFDKFFFENLLEAISHNNKIERVHLSNDYNVTTKIPHEISTLFFKMLKENKTIQSVSLIQGGFYEEEVLELAKAISDNTTLKELDLKGLGRHLTLRGKKALREVEEERTKTGWFSFGKKEPLIILLPEIPDEYLNQNKGR